jgi:transcription initiation factor TFIIIB Brf1 subunit/transcription initiation factor TFIIB
MKKVNIQVNIINNIESSKMNSCNCKGEFFYNNMCIVCGKFNYTPLVPLVSGIEDFPSATPLAQEKHKYKDFVDGRTVPCVECGCIKFINDIQQGDVICSSCGIIQFERCIDDGADWSNYENTREAGKDNSRIGWVDSTNPYSTLGSIIPKGFYEKGKNKDGKEIYYDLSKKNMIISSNNKEKAFYEVIKTFEKMTYDGSFNISTINLAKVYWNEIVKNEMIVRGGNRKGILACCILYASYQSGCSRTREQVAEKMNINYNDIIKGEPIFQDILCKNPKYRDLFDNGPNIVDMISPIISKLGLTYKHYVKECIKIYQKYSKELSEISPKAAVAGVISYLIHHKMKLKSPNKKELLKVVGITNPTLSNAVNIIKAHE